MKRITLLLLSVAFALVAPLMGLSAQGDALPGTPPVTRPEDEIVGTAPPPDLTPSPIPEPTRSVDVRAGGASLGLLFESIRQGGVGVILLQGEGVTGGRAEFLNRTFAFFQPDESRPRFYALLSVGIDQPLRTYPLMVYASLSDGTRVTLESEVRVITGGFIRQEVEIPTERAYLIDPQLERTELARLFAVFETSVNERLWNGEPFMLPIASEITSPFGAVRVLNGSAETRHTGWDLRARTGTPVLASASGRVVFAGRLDIRGNHVIIDHGYGILSGYSHLSQTNVTRGQTVSRGQVIGLSGNTGRSSGPHLHWEIAVNGEWVNSVDFIQTWLP